MNTFTRNLKKVCENVRCEITFFTNTFSSLTTKIDVFRGDGKDTLLFTFYSSNADDFCANNEDGVFARD